MFIDISRVTINYMLLCRYIDRVDILVEYANLLDHYGYYFLRNDCNFD